MSYTHADSLLSRMEGASRVVQTRCSSQRSDRRGEYTIRRWGNAGSGLSVRRGSKPPRGGIVRAGRLQMPHQGMPQAVHPTVGTVLRIRVSRSTSGCGRSIDGRVEEDLGAPDSSRTRRDQYHPRGSWRTVSADGRRTVWRQLAWSKWTSIWAGSPAGARKRDVLKIDVPFGDAVSVFCGRPRPRSKYRVVEGKAERKTRKRSQKPWGGLEQTEGGKKR
jgi:hypothetical protein